MKPFDLEAAKRGEPLVTRDGRLARYIGHAPECAENQRVVATIDGHYSPLTYSEEGLQYSGRECDADIFVAPKKRTVYVNLYKRGCGTEAAWHESREMALTASAFAQHISIAIAAPVEIEE